MKFYKFYLVALLICVSTTFTSAQDLYEVSIPEDYNAIRTATRVSEFGRISEIERRRRVDNFLIELQNNPGAAGYIIFYQGKDALPSQFGLKAEDVYLSHLKFRNFDEGRVNLISAFREKQATELWIVPAGFYPPGPTNTITPPEAAKNETLLFHRSHFDTSADDFLLANVSEERRHAGEEYFRDNGDFQNLEDETPAGLPEKSAEEANYEAFCRAGNAFAGKLKENQEDRGMVILYVDDKVFDAKKIQDDFKMRIAAVAAETGINPNRVEVVFGGYRRGIEIEMWIVPKAAKTPEASPGKRMAVLE